MAMFELPQLTQKNTKENERTRYHSWAYALSDSALGWKMRVHVSAREPNSCKSCQFQDMIICAPCATTASAQFALHDGTPRLSLWYDRSHCHGSPFLHELEPSAERSKSAKVRPFLRKPQVCISRWTSDRFKPIPCSCGVRVQELNTNLSEA